MTRLSQALIATLVYSDLFYFPLTREEIKKWLISPNRFSSQEIIKAVSFLVKKGLLRKKQGFFYLKGREKIIKLRQKRQRWSRLKLEKAKQAANLLKMIPWVRAVLLTGALARDNADREDDIDWLVITAPRRLWLTRLLVVFLLQLLGKRRRPYQGRIKDKICLNMFLSEADLALLVDERDLFTAHEVLQSKPLWQRSGSCFAFLKANAWTKKYLARAHSRILYQYRLLDQKEKQEKGREKKRDFLSGFFDFLEKKAFNLQLSYMRSKRTIEKVETGRAFFHPQDVRRWVKDKYQKKLTHLGLKPVGPA